MQRKTKSNKLAKKRIIIESTIALLIVLSPFVFKAHEYFPSGTSNYEFLWITISDGGFHDVETYMWFVLTKLVPFYLLLIWFLTCKHWWYHVILIPLMMYAFQLFEAYFSDDNTIDSENILWLLPVCMVVIPFVYFIRVKLYDKHVHGIDLKAMDTELQILKEKQALQKEREKLEKAKKENTDIF